MRKPNPPHILDYLARIKVEGTNVSVSLREKMDLWTISGSLAR